MTTTTSLVRGALVATLALAAAGCSTAVPGEASSTDPTWSQYATTTQTPPVEVVAPPPGPVTNQRGNIEKKIGEPAGMTATPGGGDTVFDFAITEVKVHTSCDNMFAKIPAGQKALAVHLVINTYNDPNEQLGMTIFGHGWEYIAPDGTSLEASGNIGQGCVYNSPDLKPNRKYTETIWLLIPANATEGWLVWQPMLSDIGYEWPLTV